jgi:hypothetical protein
MEPQRLVEIGAEHGLRVIFMDDDELHRLGVARESFVDKSATCGEEVYVGFYENDELLTASFFHEIGHRIASELSYNMSTDGLDFKVAPELIAWLLGIREAARHGVAFSAATLDWALRQALSYRGYR